MTQRVDEDRPEVLSVNGSTGLGVFRDDVLTAVFALTVSDGRVARGDVVRAPSKLAAVWAQPTP